MYTHWDWDTAFFFSERSSAREQSHLLDSVCAQGEMCGVVWDPDQGRDSGRAPCRMRSGSSLKEEQGVTSKSWGVGHKMEEGSEAPTTGHQN